MNNEPINKESAKIESEPKSTPPAGLPTPPKARLLVKETPKAYVWLAWILKFSATCYLAILILMILLESSLVFPGSPIAAGDWSHPGIALEEVDFLSTDGTQLHGFFFPNPKSDQFLLFCHGNGENIATIASEMDLLRKQWNVSVFAFDYRGYGKSGGSPGEEGVLADGEAAAKWLANRSQQPIENLIIMGRSLGGGVAVHLASVVDPQALILDRTFSSTVDVAADRYWWLPVRYVMRNQFWSIVRIKRYAGPLFQMHGDKDEVIPIWSGKKLFAAAPSEEKYFMEIAGLYHNDPWPQEFLDQVDGFINGEAELTPKESLIKAKSPTPDLNRNSSEAIPKAPDASSSNIDKQSRSSGHWDSTSSSNRVYQGSNTVCRSRGPYA
jgi:uncharacterized protein